MSRATIVSTSATFGCLLLAVAAAGCAHLRAGDPPVASVTDVRQQRAEQVLKGFETRRSFAEFEAALARWNQDDVQGCRRRLEALLQRDPQHHDAQVLLAQIHLHERRPQAAWALIATAVATDPNDAVAQYTAGLVLDVTGRSGDALVYYERAVELQPQNPEYELSYRAARNDFLATSAPLDGPGVSPQQPSTPRSPALPDTATSDPGPPRPVVELNAAPVVDLNVRQSTTSEIASALDVLADNLTTTPVDPKPKRLQLPPAAPRLAAVSPAESIANTLTGVRLALHHEPARATTNVADSDSTDDASGSDAAAGTDGAASVEDAAGADSSSAVGGVGANVREPDELETAIAAAVSTLQANRPDLAVTLLEDVKGRFCSSARLYRILGTAHYRVGNYASSEVALRQALSLDKSNALSYFLMGCTLAKLGQTESAETHFRRAGQLNPSYAQRR